MTVTAEEPSPAEATEDQADKVQQKKWREQIMAAQKGLAAQEGLAVHDLRKEVNEMIRILGVLPEKVKKNPYYPPFLERNFRASPESLELFLDNFGQGALFVPRKKNEERVQSVIEEVAVNICKKLNLDESHKKVITLAIREAFEENLKTFEETPILVKKNGEKIPPVAFKKAFKTVKGLLESQRIKREEASFALLFLVGIIDQEEVGKCPKRPLLERLWNFIKLKKEEQHELEKLFQVLRSHDVSELIKNIEESIIWAREYIEDMVKKFKDIQKEYEATDKLEQQVNNELDPNQDLGGRNSSFDWIEIFYNSKISSLRDHNDAHLMVLFGVIHLQELLRLKKMSVRFKKSHIEDNLVEGLLERNSQPIKVIIPTLRLEIKEGKPEFILNKTKRSLDCRRLKAEGHLTDANEKDRVILMTAMGHKKIAARVKKRLNRKSKNIGPDKILDEVRMRMVFVNMNSVGCSQKNKKQIIEQAMMNAATSLNLSLEDRRKDLENSNSSKSALHLRKGEFMIEDDLTHPRYPKMTLFAKLPDGTNVEVQGVPLDTYAFDNAHRSGVDHRVKDALETIETLQTAVPVGIPEIGPLVDEVSRYKKEEISKLIEQTRVARESFPIESLIAEITG